MTVKPSYTKKKAEIKDYFLKMLLQKYLNAKNFQTK